MPGLGQLSRLGLAAGEQLAHQGPEVPIVEAQPLQDAVQFQLQWRRNSWREIWLSLRPARVQLVAGRTGKQLLADLAEGQGQRIADTERQRPQ